MTLKIKIYLQIKVCPCMIVIMQVLVFSKEAHYKDVYYCQILQHVWYLSHQVSAYWCNKYPVEFINTGIADIRIYTLINKDLSLGVNRRYSGNDQDFIGKRENRQKNNNI